MCWNSGDTMNDKINKVLASLGVCGGVGQGRDNRLSFSHFP
jgi:hypothetical protein